MTEFHSRDVRHGMSGFQGQKVLIGGLLGKVERFIIGVIRGRGGGRISMMMGKEVGGVPDAVEAVSLLKLVQVVRTVRICLCTVKMREAMTVDMISPRHWSTWVRRSIDL